MFSICNSYFASWFGINSAAGKKKKKKYQHGAGFKGPNSFKNRQYFSGDLKLPLSWLEVAGSFQLSCGYLTPENFSGQQDESHTGFELSALPALYKETQHTQLFKISPQFLFAPSVLNKMRQKEEGWWVAAAWSRAGLLQAPAPSRSGEVRANPSLSKGSTEPCAATLRYKSLH